jgi:hypothetical protein
MKKFVLILNALLLLFTCSQSLTAQTLSIYSFANNWLYSGNDGEDGFYGTSPGIVGFFGRYRAISRFDLSSVTSPVLGATLSLRINEVGDGVGLQIRDADASLYPPLNQWSSAAADLWTDVGTGSLYGGSYSIYDGWNSFTLSPSALMDINSILGSNFAVGMAATNDTWQYAFNYYARLDLQLDNTVPPMATPEPGTIFLLGSSLFAIAAYRRRRSKKNL